MIGFGPSLGLLLKLGLFTLNSLYVSSCRSKELGNFFDIFQKKSTVFSQQLKYHIFPILISLQCFQDVFSGTCYQTFFYVISTGESHDSLINIFGMIKLLLSLIAGNYKKVIRYHKWQVNKTTQVGCTTWPLINKVLTSSHWRMISYDINDLYKQSIKTWDQW